MDMGEVGDIDVMDDEEQKRLCHPVHKSNRILTTSHSLVALEESFNSRCNVVQLAGCKQSHCNIAPVVVDLSFVRE